MPVPSDSLFIIDLPINYPHKTNEMLNDAAPNPYHLVHAAHRAPPDRDLELRHGRLPRNNFSAQTITLGSPMSQQQTIFYKKIRRFVIRSMLRKTKACHLVSPRQNF